MPAAPCLDTSSGSERTLGDICYTLSEIGRTLNDFRDTFSWSKRTLDEACGTFWITASDAWCSSEPWRVARLHITNLGDLVPKLWSRWHSTTAKLQETAGWHIAQSPRRPLTLIPLTVTDNVRHGLAELNIVKSVGKCLPPYSHYYFK